MAQSVEVKPTTDPEIIVSNSLVLLVRRALLWGLNSILILFLPRYLGDAGLGQLAYAQSLAGLLATAMSLGVGQYLIKSIARDRTQIARLLPPAIGLRIIMTIIAFGIIVAAASLIGRTTDARNVMYIMGATAVVLSFVHLMTSVINGLENMTWPALAEIVSKLVVLSVGIFVLVKGFGVAPYAMVLLGAALVYLALNAGYVARRFPLKASFNFQALKTVAIGGMPFLAMGLLLDVYNQADTVILRLFTSDAVVGWYAAATQMYRTLEMLPLALTTALLPTLSRIHAQGVGGSIAIAKKCIGVGALVIIPVAFGISLLSKEIIDLLPYPDSFSNTVPLLTILALTIPVTAFLTILGTIAVAVDRQKAFVIGLSVTVALNIVLNVLAAPYFQERYGNGGIGVALSTLVCEAIMVAIGVRLMPKGVIDRTLTALLLKTAAAGGAMVLLGLLVRYLGLGTIPLVIVAAATYISLIVVSRAVTKEDARFVRELALRKLKRTKNAQPR